MFEKWKARDVQTRVAEYQREHKQDFAAALADPVKALGSRFSRWTVMWYYVFWLGWLLWLCVGAYVAWVTFESDLGMYGEFKPVAWLLGIL